MGRPKKNSFSTSQITNFIKKRKFTLEELLGASPRMKTSILSILCEHFNVKNNFKSRLLFYYRVRKDISEIKFHFQKAKEDILPEVMKQSSFDRKEFGIQSKQSNPKIIVEDDDMLRNLPKTASDMTSLDTIISANNDCGMLFSCKAEKEEYSKTENITLDEDYTHNMVDDNNGVNLDNDPPTENNSNFFKFLMSANTNRYEANIDLSKNSELRHTSLKKKLLSLGVYCVLIFKGHRINKKIKNRSFKIIEYAKCKQTNCRFFKFVYNITENEASIVIYYKGPQDTDHTEEYSYWLKGAERKLVKEKLKLTLPNVLRNSHIDQVDPEVILDGNWQNLRSLSVYQKARSEALAEHDKHTNVILDLTLRAIEQKADEKYIQFPNGRTLVHLYSKDQVRILLKKGQKITAYFDATGSVVRCSPYETGHRVLYYSLVVNVGGKIVPIAEMITSRNDSATITGFLIAFKHFVRVECNKTWPIFNAIVIDWSFALMTSVCQGCNDMTLYTYLQLVFKYVTNCLDQSRVFHLIPLKSCCAHFIKMICNRVSSIKHKSVIKNVIVDSVAVLMQCTSLEELSFYFENVVTLLLSQNYDSRVKAVLKELASKSYKNLDDFLLLREETKDFSDGLDIDEEKVRGNYTTSPFFIYFFRIYDEVSRNIQNFTVPTKPAEKNPYKSEEFCMYLLKRIMPFAPLWTDILDIGCFSNANVECWYKILKKEILGGQTNMKVGRFVSKVHDRIKTELKTVVLDIGKVPKKKKKIIKGQCEIDNPKEKEEWKRVNRKAGFLYQKHLKNIQIDSNLNYKECTDTDDVINDEPNTEILHELEKYNSCEDSPDKRALQNGLFFNNNFYMMSALKESFVLGKYTYCEQTITLASSDYRTLISTYNVCNNQILPTGSERWASDYCLDALAACLLEYRQDIYYVDSISSHILLGDQAKTFTKFKPFVKSFQNIRYVLLPHDHNDIHWVLIILDLKENDIYILNPGKNYLLSETDIFKKIKRFFSTRDRLHETQKLNIRKWKVSIIPYYPRQDLADSVNCGIYVIYYIYILTKINDIQEFAESSMQDNFDPERFRITLQNILLLISQDMYNKCLRCGNTTQGEYVECSVCTRWLHFQNCSAIDPKVSIGTVQNENYVYTCLPCKMYNGDPFQSRERNTDIFLSDLEIEFLIIHYTNYLKNIYDTRNSNEECRRYRESSNLEHLKWDYSTAFITFDTSVKICRLIIKHGKINDLPFVSYVLLGLTNYKIICRYYGMKECGADLITKYKTLHNIHELEYDLPVSYTLDAILAEISNI